MSSYLHVWADFYSVPEMVYTTYNMGKRDLPVIYACALGLGHIYQANPSWAQAYIYQANPPCPCYYNLHIQGIIFASICNVWFFIRISTCFVYTRFGKIGSGTSTIQFVQTPPSLGWRLLKCVNFQSMHCLYDKSGARAP